jgi:hypothetical protein
MRCQRHLGGRLRFSLDTSNSAVFFCGVSKAGFNISTSALLFVVPSKSVNHANIGGGSLLYQVWLVRVNQRSILRDAVQANCFIGSISLLPRRLALPASSQRHNKKFKSFASLTGTRIKAARPITKMLGIVNVHIRR